MKITRERKHVVNMGNYESLTIGATVEIDTAERLTEAGNVNEYLDSLLDEVLADEVNEAKELTNTKDSYILSYRGK